MQWNDELILIAIAAPDKPTNENGFPNPPTETKSAVFANKKSVGYAEFYKAQQAGYSVEIKFDVYAEEYHGEPFAEHEGKRYKVLRTYLSKNGETVELTLSDLTERGSGGNGTD